MQRAEVVQLLEEALVRVRVPRRNGNGGSEQIGGVYWRLVKVLTHLDPQLDAQEGAEHAKHIRAFLAPLSESWSRLSHPSEK